ncbi:MAG: hypothetical protein ACXV3E_08535 [Halobacteriota archaeon]
MDAENQCKRSLIEVVAAWKEKGNRRTGFPQTRLLAEGGVNEDEAIGNWFHPTY